jgi:hypothetical protein
MGAIGTRLSLRPLIGGQGIPEQTSRETSGEIAKPCVHARSCLNIRIPRSEIRATSTAQAVPGLHPEERALARVSKDGHSRALMVRDAPTGPREARPDDKLRRAPHHEDFAGS